MSSFVVNITPTRVTNKQRNVASESVDVYMAPFSVKSIVQFDDVPVTKTARRVIRIINPSKRDIEVKVTKRIKPEYKVSIEWFEKLVKAESDTTMEITWTPQARVACTESMVLTDNRNFRKDVMVILKSKPPKLVKNARTYRSIPSGIVGKSPLKSPINLRKVSKITTPHSIQTSEKIMNCGKMRKFQSQSTTRNFDVKYSVPKVVVTQTSPLSEQNALIDNRFRTFKRDTNVKVQYDNSSKENRSPLTPVKVMDFIDQLQFTPAIEINHSIMNFESLVNLPTPSATEYSYETHRNNLLNIRPKRLNIDKAIAELNTNETFIDPKCITSTSIFTNKTFDLKDTCDISNNSLSNSLENDDTSNKLPLDKTTTINCSLPTRHLEAIEEEPSIITKCSQQSSNKLDIPSLKCTTTDSNNLKRDIKLIGTPLRKFSESMTDLSLKSPVAKPGIQGSMPNLNDIETLRSIEQNRYYHKTQNEREQCMSAIAENSRLDLTDYSIIEPNQQKSPTLHVDLIFNKSEILAQSSRFNINEVGLRSNKHEKYSFTNKTTKCNQQKIFQKSDNCKKRTALDLASSDSPSNEFLSNSTPVTTKTVLQPKRQRIDLNYSFNRPDPVNASAARKKNWTISQPKSAKLIRTLSLVKKPVSPRFAKCQPRVRLYDSDFYLQSFINPDPFAATTTCDPFLASTMYLDERAVDKHLTDFKKWLNALVTIPSELSAECNTKIDVGKLFNEVRNKDLTLAPSKEEQSLNYLTTIRLESLRRAAVELFLSEEMRVPCSKVAIYVNKNAIRIRNDRNLHLDVIMQRYILELLLCFNPLWLRLGLEVVYGEKIHLTSNSDIVGLSSFILNRLFRDKFLEQKYSKAYTLSEEYADHIKKFSLQKMLLLLLFLDKAKTKRIIKHNPCLFVKSSPHKETRQILLKFSSELLGQIGDITRELKRLSYVLEHKQTVLDEFDYAFNNLAVDLRDGIRLTRVMEIILLRDDLSQQLRVPAISRLQRVFNVNLALKALKDNDFQLKGDISAADIVDGHREKTLSLLWQLIYKFRSPKFHAAATVLQLWWRHCWLRVTIKRRIQRREFLRQQKAATIIQAYFRSYITRRYVKEYKQKLTETVVILQKYARGFLVRKHMQEASKASVIIQRWYRAQVVGLQCRQNFLILRSCVVFVQRWYRRRLFSKKLINFIELAVLYCDNRKQAAASKIQKYWLNYCLVKKCRNEFRNLRKSVVFVQRKYRAKKAMIAQRNSFKELRQSCLIVQNRFRANRKMKLEHAGYKQLRLSTIKIQQRRRSLLKTRKFYSEFQRKRAAVLSIQRKWRATLLARRVHFEYITLEYHVTVVQQVFKANKIMRIQRAEFLSLRNAVINVQRRFRGKLIMKEIRESYLCKLQAVKILQQRYRAYKQMRFQRAKFRGTRAAVICLQQHWRNFLQMRSLKMRFLMMRLSAVVLQRHYRGRQLTRSLQSAYQAKRHASIKIQRSWRGYTAMKKQCATFQQQRHAVQNIQRWYRSILLMRKEKQQYRKVYKSIVQLQQKWRAIRLTRQQRSIYLQDYAKLVYVQRLYRGKLQMRREREAYLKQRAAAIVLQRRFRARLVMLSIRSQYLLIVSLIVCIQRKFRAHQLMLRERQQFMLLKRTVVHLQQRFRGRRLMQIEQEHFQLLRGSVVNFQTHARGYLARQRFQALMTPEMIHFLARKKAAKFIQRIWRGYRVRKQHCGKRLVEIRQHLAIVNKNSNESNSVRNIVKNAVKLLKSRFNASEALNVLVRLERISRFVPYVLNGSSSNFIATFCYGIMTQAIRSEIDKQLIQYCSRILLNLARCNSTTANTFQEGGLVTIAQMLLRWCDKESEIFNTLCTLIWIFSECPKKRRIIHNFMTTPEAIYMVRETKKLVIRKEKMKQNVRKPIIFGSTGKPQTNEKAQFSSRSMPSLEPDYGVIHSKPYTFISSMYAFEIIITKLGIELY